MEETNINEDNDGKTEFSSLPNLVIKDIMEKVKQENRNAINSLIGRQNLTDRRLGLATPATIEYLHQENPEFLREITRAQRVYDKYEDAKIKRTATNRWITEFNRRIRDF